MATKLELSTACLRLLRPLARIMLRHGLSSYDFSRIANIAFVRAAGDILREQGKPMSFSRISTITGLHRHVVSDIVNSPPEAGRGCRLPTRTIAVTGWPGSCQDGSKARATRTAMAGRSRSRSKVLNPLSRRSSATFSGDIYPRIILDELVEVGAVKLLKDGSVRAHEPPLLIGRRGACRDPASRVRRDATSSARWSTTLRNRRKSGTTTTRSYRCAWIARPSRCSGVCCASVARRFSETSKDGSRSTRSPARRTRCAPGVIVQMFVDADSERSEIAGRRAIRMISAYVPPASGTRPRRGS